MSKPKNIILFTIGNIDHPSSRIRGIQYIPFLEKAGYNVKWIPRIPKKPRNNFEKLFIFPFKKQWYSFLRTYHLRYSKPEFFFIQKIFISEKTLQRANNGYSKIIFDFDDAIYLDKNNPNAKSNTDIMIKYADSIIVSNTILSDYCKALNNMPLIVNTPIDIHRITPNKTTENSVFTIGWIGSFWTTKYLNIIADALQEVSKKHEIRLLLVGADTSFKIEGVNVEYQPWSFKRESEHLNLFDIGIMPLSEDEYSKAKGGYKLLMYMAAGIPQIASPVGINSEIVLENKTGFLADSQEQWIQAIQLFINNRKEITTFGATSRKEAELKYSREVCFDKMIELLR